MVEWFGFGHRCRDTGPSGITLDPTKVNVYSVTYLGAGAVLYSIMGADNRLWPAHRLRWLNVESTLSVLQPSLRLGWFAASLGSTTALTVKGGSAGAFVDGELRNLRDPVGIQSSLAATTSETTIPAVRVRGEFGGTINQREGVPLLITCGLETTNRLATFRVYLNPTLGGTPIWTRVSTTSAVDYTTTSVTRTDGTLLTTITANTSNSLPINDFGVRCEPGDVLAITVEMVSSTSTASATLTLHEN